MALAKYVAPCAYSLCNVLKVVTNFIEILNSFFLVWISNNLGLNENYHQCHETFSCHQGRSSFRPISWKLQNDQSITFLVNPVFFKKCLQAYDHCLQCIQQHSSARMRGTCSYSVVVSDQVGSFSCLLARLSAVYDTFVDRKGSCWSKKGKFYATNPRLVLCWNFANLKNCWKSYEQPFLGVFSWLIH